MIQAILIEDEIKSRETLAKMLDKYCSKTVHLLASAKSVEEGVKVITTLKPELIFLDIILGNRTCFELLTQLPNLDFFIVFSTNYNNYAVEAFGLVQ